MLLDRIPGQFIDAFVDHGSGRRGLLQAWGWSLFARLAVGVLAAGCGNSPGTGGVSDSLASGQGHLALTAVVSDLTGSCAAAAPGNDTRIRFTLGGISVVTDKNTQFKIPCETIANGTPVEAQGGGVTNGTLAAHEIEARADGGRAPQFEVEGHITSLNPAFDCVTVIGRSITVASLAFQVGNAFTRFTGIPGGCQGLVAGLGIEARGSLTNAPLSPVLPLRARDMELGESRR